VTLDGRLRIAFEDENVRSDNRRFVDRLQHLGRQSHAAMRDTLSDRLRVVGSVNHDAFAEIERVFAEVTFDETLWGVERRNGIAVFDERPVGFAPDRIDDLAQHAQTSARRAKHPDVVAVLEDLFTAARARRLANQLPVLEEIRGVRREIDRDDRSLSRRVGGQALDFAAKLPPMTIGFRGSGE